MGLENTTNDESGKKKLRMKDVVDAEASTFGNNPQYWETHEEVERSKP